MIEFTCSCGKPLQADEQYAGRKTRCPACGQERVIPGHAASVTPDVPAGSARSSDVRTEPERRGGRGYDDRPLTESTRMSGKAIAALVLGVVSLGCSFFAAIPALVLGFLALSDIGKSQGRLSGKPLAIIGLLASAFSMLCIAPGAGFGLYKGYVFVGGRKDRITSQNNLKQLAMALHNYEMDNGTLPPQGTSVIGQPVPGSRQKVSWRVRILPYIEGENLYAQYNQNEPWDGPNNSQLLLRMPKIYELPSATTAPPGHTYYQVFVSPSQTGPHAAFETDRAVRLTSFTDGTSNTLLIVEAATAVPWTKPEDIPFDPNGPVPMLGRHFPGGCNVAMGDGSVRFLSSDVPSSTLKALITRDGNEVVSDY